MIIIESKLIFYDKNKIKYLDLYKLVNKVLSWFSEIQGGC